jgi:DnaK suppressor protein
VARNTSRKPLVAKKAASRGRVAAVVSGSRKSPSAKIAVVAAKPKAASRPAPQVVLKAAPSKAAAAPPPTKVIGKSQTGKPVVVTKPAAEKAKSHEAVRHESGRHDSGRHEAGRHESRRHEPAPRPQPMPIPDAVPTNGKPRKNLAGLSSKELEHYRDLLLEKRRELVGDMYSMESEALRTSGGTNLSSLPLHMADMGTDNYEQEFTLGLVEKDRGLLREINSALAKIQNGTYGICEGTGKPISKPRLEAQPWARHSIEYARQTQRPMGFGMRVG